MPITISSPKFSLVKFDNLDSYKLPAYEKFNSAFQFIVNGDYEITDDLKLGILNNAGSLIPNVFVPDVFATPISYILDVTEFNYDAWDSFFLLSITVNGILNEYNQTVTKAQLKTILFEQYGYEAISNNRFYDNGTGNIFTLSFQQAENPIPGGGSYEVINHDAKKLWWRGYIAAPGTLIGDKVGKGSCFRYCLLDKDNNIVGKTNVFKVENSKRFLSLVTYSNNENAFDFSYPVIYNNIQLLPIYLSRPQWPTKRTVYEFSNGNQKLLSASLKKRYPLRADFMPESFHEAFTVLMLHDNIIIDCTNIKDSPVTVIASEDYQVEWDEETEHGLAQGRSIVTVATFGYTNNNCD